MELTEKRTKKITPPYETVCLESELDINLQIQTEYITTDTSVPVDDPGREKRSQHTLGEGELIAAGSIDAAVEARFEDQHNANSEVLEKRKQFLLQLGEG